MIRQLIDAEREAAEIEAQAEREAEAILARSRQEASALAEALRADGRRRGAEHLAAAVLAAEADKAAALARVAEPANGTVPDPALREALVTAVARVLAGRP